MLCYSITSLPLFKSIYSHTAPSPSSSSLSSSPSSSISCSNPPPNFSRKPRMSVEFRRISLTGFRSCTSRSHYRSVSKQTTRRGGGRGGDSSGGDEGGGGVMMMERGGGGDVAGAAVMEAVVEMAAGWGDDVDDF
ncbi:hypothetical protein Tco_0496155 [Tanacetum coccineum]